jgi:hypothetical protein
MGKPWVYHFLPKQVHYQEQAVWDISIDFDYSVIVASPEKKSSFQIENLAGFTNLSMGQIFRDLKM